MKVLIDILSNPTLIIATVSGIATFLAVLSFLFPYIRPNNMQNRLVAITNQRKNLQTQQLEMLQKRSSLRRSRENKIRLWIEQIKLKDLMGGEELRHKLLQANWRSPNTFLIFASTRFIAPIICAALTGLLLFSGKYTFAPSIKWILIFAGAVAGFYLPKILLINTIKRRQIAFQRAFPDALDLLTICVESGLSIEDAFGRVAQEMGSTSPILTEEFELTTAELAYLPDRRQAFENLAIRTGLASVKTVTTSLIQAEKYGTPLASALRVASQESRDNRMAAAEKKAASLPAKLTVPMILFFLPVLFIVILGPAIIQIINR